VRHLVLYVVVFCPLGVPAEEILPQLAGVVGAGAVYCHSEVTTEEVGVEAAVASALDKAGAALKVGWAGTIHVLADLTCHVLADLTCPGRSYMSWQILHVLADLTCPGRSCMSWQIFS
jgi:hypothetical protein